MELNGIIEHIGAIEENGTFKKRSLILGTEKESQYPQSINIEFQQDKTSLLDSLVVGQEAKVFINLAGRKWTDANGIDKWFNTIKGWKIEAKTNAF